MNISSIQSTGSTFVNSDSGQVAGAFLGFYVVAEASISSITATSKTTAADKLEGVTIPAGVFVPIELTQIAVDAGLICLLNA